MMLHASAKTRIACAALASSLVAGCSGGSAALAPSPAAAPAAPALKATHHLSGALHITIPPRKTGRHQRKPRFVSPSTKSISLTINGQAAAIFDVAVPPCTQNTDGSFDCTFAVSAPYGHDTFSVSLYDAANAHGTLLGAGTATCDVKQDGFGPSITVVPVSGSIGLSIANPSITTRVTSSTTLTVSEFDPDGNQISGTYPHPITIASTDATGAIVPTPSQVTASGQTVTLKYSGSTMMYGGASITASAPGVASASATFTIATPCAPKFTPATLYATWDTNATDNVIAFNAPFGQYGTDYASVTFPVYMSVDPNGHIFVAQANTSSYPASTANVVYFTPPSPAQISVTPSNLNLAAASVDDQGNLFVSERNGTTSSVYESAGPLPAVGSNYATPVQIPNSPTGSYALVFDKYCNLFVDGTNTSNDPYVEILGTTGQSGGGYGQLTPVINTSSGFTGGNGMAFDSHGNLFVGGSGSIQELAPPYTGTPTTLFATQSGGYLASLTTDASDNLYFADYEHNTINESSPPYSTYTTINTGTLSLADGVVIGPQYVAP